MDGIKMVLVAALIIQEIQIIFLNKKYDEAIDLLGLLVSGKADKVIKVLIDENSEEDDESTGE